MSTNAAAARVFSLRTISRPIRLAGLVIASVSTIGTAASAFYFSEHMFATRAEVKTLAKDQVATALVRLEAEQRTATDKITLLQRDGTETRLQVNGVRRSALRNELFTREMQMKAATDPAMRQLLKQKIDEIQDELNEVNDERSRLRLSAP